MSRWSHSSPDVSVFWTASAKKTLIFSKMRAVFAKNFFIENSGWKIVKKWNPSYAHAIVTLLQLWSNTNVFLFQWFCADKLCPPCRVPFERFFINFSWSNFGMISLFFPEQLEFFFNKTPVVFSCWVALFRNFTLIVDGKQTGFVG